MSYVRKALELEALCKSRQHGVYAPPSGDTGRVALAWWWYKCQARPWVQRLLALVAAAVSAAMVWSEATIATGTSPDLSPFSLVRAARRYCRGVGGRRARAGHVWLQHGREIVC
jgi:hypothetical protein